jgi:hypothetical protein
VVRAATVAMQRRGKHSSTTIQAVFSMLSVPKGYLEDNWGDPGTPVTLRVVAGDEKGSLESETLKYGRESQGTRTRERLRWQGPAAYKKDRPVLSSERAPHKNKAITVKE